MKTWKKLPGGFDPLHTETLYPSDNAFDIPDLSPQPENLWPTDDLFALRYRQPIRTQRPLLLHFHTYDYRFENVWNEPARGVRATNREQIWAACTPDFSLWLEYPLAMQIWNTYRNRWSGCHWQQRGVTVVPSVNWSHPDSYDFCFLGIPKHQIITLRTYKDLSPVERAFFEAGYAEMVKQLEPRCILWFGHIDTVITDTIPKFVFPVGGPSEYLEQRAKWAATAD